MALRNQMIALTAVLSSAVAAACGAPEPKPMDPKAGQQEANPSSSSSSATSAKDLGGMEKLVEAAEKEGRLNVIGLDSGWANLGEMIAAFQRTYDVEVMSANPKASSLEEIETAKRFKGTQRAPDVFDLDQQVAVANERQFAPYQVTKFMEIPEKLRDPEGRWFGNYGGYMSIGYDSEKVKAPARIKDLLNPAYRGKVALHGDPVEAKTAFHGTVMAALGAGGSADELKPGVDFLAAMKKAGNLAAGGAGARAGAAAGGTPVVLDWEFTNAARGENWKSVIPRGAAVGTYYTQAINKDAPHPAAARLWAEFVLSNEGQNILMRGKARPVRLEAMRKAGSLDADALAELPATSGTPVFPSAGQIDKAREYLAGTWSKKLG